MARFTDDQVDRLFKGQRVECHSSFVDAARYDPVSGKLTIFIRDREYTSLRPLSESEVGDFALAISKGTWLNEQDWWQMARKARK